MMSEAVGRARSSQKADLFVSKWIEFSPRIRRCCFKWLNGDLDRVEETMALLAEKSFKKFMLQDYAIKSYFSWLYKIAYNISIDIHRATKKDRDIVQSVSDLPDTFYFSTNQSGELEDDIEREELAQIVTAIVESLPVESRNLILLRCVHGMEYSELSLMLGITEENVRKKIHLIRRSILIEMENY